MTTRELRTEIEALQSDIKHAQETLALPDSEALLAELEAGAADAATAEAEATRLERETASLRERLVPLREAVESAEQRALGSRAQRDVSPLALLATLGTFAFTGWACFTLLGLPRTPLLELVVKGVAIGVWLPAAWIIKRRLLRPGD